MLLAKADEDHLLFEAIELLLNEDFVQATVLFDSLDQKYPADPLPSFLKGVLYWRQSYNMENYQKFDNFILKHYRKSIKLSDALLRKKSKDSYALFFKGGAFGYTGSVYVRDKNLIKGGISGYKGIKYLQKAFELDSTYWDIYYGMGLYHVAAANSPSIVKFLQKILPIPSGDEDLDLLVLKNVIKKDIFLH